MEKQIEKYQIVKPLYEDYNEKIKVLIKSLIDENNIKYQLIESRTKSIASFREKVIRKDNKYSNPLEEITDLAGIRIIVYYQDDVDKIEKIIKNEFIIDAVNSIDKGKLLKANEFGYQSVHYVIKLSRNRNRLLEWKKFAAFKAEIQIRTVLQHSWASISHELEYKKNYEIPSVLRRRLFRLASLIELADEEFMQSRDQHSVLLSKILNGKLTDSVENNEILEELNLLTLNNYIKDSVIVAKITAEATKAGFKKNDKQNEKYNSQIIKLCHLLDIRSISELNHLLENSYSKSFTLFKTLLKNQTNEWEGNSVFYILLILINENIANIKDSSFLIKEEGWGKEIADLVLNTFRNLKN